MTTLKLDKIFNLDRYPIHDLSSNRGIEFVQSCRQELDHYSCFVLRNFITAEALLLAQQEANLLAPLANDETRYTNPYKTSDDPSLPDNHPVRYFMKRTNVFVTKDLFKPDSFMLSLYNNFHLKQFIVECLKTNIYDFNDPMAGVTLNVLRSGAEHPWHFDDPEITLVLMIQSSQQGGTVEYAPSVRSSDNENYELVRQVLEDRYSGLRHIQMQSSDLMVILGRNTLHRVTEVLGSKERYSAAFCYSTDNGAINRTETNQILFGRVKPEGATV